MDDDFYCRRRLILASAVAALSPLYAAAQDGKKGQTDFDYVTDAKKAGEHHDAAMSVLIERLGKGADLSSRNAIKSMVDYLQDHGMISTKDSKHLDDMLDLIFSATSPEQLMNELKSFADKTVKSSQSVMTAAVTIAASSARLARKTIGDANMRETIFIVTSDLSGALLGAAGVATIAAVVPVPAVLIPLAIVAMVSGASVGSLTTYYSLHPKG